MKRNYLTLMLLICITYLLQANTILPIYPEENSIISPDEFIAIFSVDRSIINSMTKDSVKLFFNGEDYSHLVRFTPFTITFQPDKALKNRPDIDGLATVTLIISYPQDHLTTEAKDSNAVIEYDSWIKDSSTITFTISIPDTKSGIDTTKSAVEKPFINRGTIYTNQLVDIHFSDSTNYLGELGASGSGYKDKFFYNYNLFLSSDEEKTNQTMHRFRLATGYGKVVKATFGDATPTMHEYILNGTRVRGINLNLSTPRKKANIDFIWGTSKRSIEPYLYDSEGLALAKKAHDSLVLIDSTTPAFSHNDSNYYYLAGTYKRNILGTRLHFGDGTKLKYGLTFMKARDDTASIDQLYKLAFEENSGITDTVIASTGTTPKDNLLLGQELSLYFWKRRIKLFTNMALSIYTEDIGDGALSTQELEDYYDVDEGSLPFDPKNIESLIILNSSSTPLPSMKGFRNSTVLDAGIKLNLPIGKVRERFEFTYQQIGSNYKSLLNETLIGNKRGFTIKEDIRLLNNKLFTSIKFNYFQDNLNELKLEPTINTGVLGIVNLLLSKEVPQINFMISTNRDRNESPDSTKYDKDNKIDIWGLGGNYTRETGGFKNTYSVHYSNTAFMASSSSMTTSSRSNSHLISASVVTNFSTIPFKSRVSISNSYTDASTDIDIINPAIGCTYQLIPNKWNVSGDARLYRIFNKDDMGTETTVKRFEGVLGSRYKFSERHSLFFTTSGQTSHSSELSKNSNSLEMKLFYEFRY